MIANVSPLRTAVVIATSNRPQLLAERAISSLLAQTRSPDILIVVDDSNPETRVENAQLVRSLVIPNCQVLYLENARAPGASGGWNTAIDYLVGLSIDPDDIYVAILDDDDSWSPHYLEACLATICASGLDMVAADILRIESFGANPILNESPATLCADDCLTHNPGIQGSNLFVRLSILLAAGGFDEALSSTTDRDLCIRIADLGTVRYGRIPAALVNHFAEPDRARLSTKGSRAKLGGLTAFWHKYYGRMRPAQRAAFLQRASTLFAWEPPNGVSPSSPTPAIRRRTIILGLVVDRACSGGLLRIIRELARWKDDTLVGLDVLLLESSSLFGESDLLQLVSTKIREAGIGCFAFPLERQSEDSANGLFVCSPEQHQQDAPVLVRTMLRIYGSRVAEGRVGAEVWIGGDVAGYAEPPSGTTVSEMLEWLRATPTAAAFQTTLPAGEPAIRAVDQWIQRERLLSAELRVRRRLSLESLRVLGSGSEAVVFTDGRRVYKCIDYWKTRMPAGQLRFLQEQIGLWEDTPGLYPLRAVVDDGLRAILTYDFEVSVPYEGGREPDLIALMNSCCAKGIVCNNIHPKNLVVTTVGVKLIDYGSDIRPWSPLGFEHMARRAFLSSRHASHPNLSLLMRRSLMDSSLHEFEGYDDFKRRLDAGAVCPPSHRARNCSLRVAPHAKPFNLYVGVISSDPAHLQPLLATLMLIESIDCLQKLSVLVLDNGCPQGQLLPVVREARRAGLHIAIIEESQQRRDAEAGSFGAALRHRPRGQVGISGARTMLQRYIGTLMEADSGSIGWMLDDDMRLDTRARAYLPWLPAFREQGTDVLIGAYEGSSPNPPLNGLRGQLVDMVHNLHWLSNCAEDSALPDRSAENAILRARFPDYYYDLSRKHTAHLEMPHWIEPCFRGETVREARSRLIAHGIGLLGGVHLSRPLLPEVPADPLAAAQHSVNRGGTTFVLNHHALTLTPNMILSVQGREARRSDMFWAIVNRNYRRMTVKSVGFPVQHVGRRNVPPTIGVEKLQAEILGSTLYSGLTQFLDHRSGHDLRFTSRELDEICAVADNHLSLRWRMLAHSFHRIGGLGKSLRRVATGDELQELLLCLDRWFSPQAFAQLRHGGGTHASNETREFLSSMRTYADEFASKTVSVEFIRSQL